jgi:flagellar assembly protein FliH
MSSSAESNPAFAVPVMALEYRDLAAFSASGTAAGRPLGTRFADGNSRSHADGMLSKAEVDERVKVARAEAATQARQEYEQKLEAARTSIAATLRAFETERAEYYARVEAEVVQLALAIAAKILHREAQVDPMLVAALVRMAMEKMRDGSSVTVRVGRGNGKRWKEFFDRQPGASRFEVVEDEGLSNEDCVVETELGSTNFGLDTQLKEVEQGFFDLLALRPVKP